MKTNLVLLIAGLLSQVCAANSSKEISAIDCSTKLVIYDLKQNQEQEIPSQTHSLRVTWKLDAIRYELYNYFLKDEDTNVQPIMAQQKATIKNDDNVNSLVTVNTSSFVVTQIGKVRQASLDSNLLFVNAPDGSRQSYSLAANGTKTLAGTRSPVTSTPSHFTYSTTLAPESFPKQAGLRIRSDESQCSEEILPPTFLDGNSSSIFETKIAKFEKQFRRLTESHEALQQCKAASATCANEEKAFEEISAQTDSLWRKLIGKNELSRIPFVRMRQAEHQRWLREQREAARQKGTDAESGDYYGNGGISDETRRKLDCLQLDQAASRAGINGVGGILAGSSLCH